MTRGGSGRKASAVTTVRLRHSLMRSHRDQYGAEVGLTYTLANRSGIFDFFTLTKVGEWFA